MTEKPNLAEIERELGEITAPPWTVYKQELALTELGKRRGFKGPDYDVRVGTAWDHPQLKGPDAIITISVTPFFWPTCSVYMRDQDAEFIAKSPERIRALLGMVVEERAKNESFMRQFLGFLIAHGYKEIPGPTEEDYQKARAELMEGK